MARRPQQLDDRIEIVTPENIAFQYRVAGPFARLPAYLLDALIQIGTVLVAMLLLSATFGMTGLWGMGFGLMLVIWFVVAWFYGGLFETFWNGQTPGKRMCGLRVVSRDGQPIDALQAVLRNLLRAVDGMPLMASGYIPTYQVGLFASMQNDRLARLGDLACGTMVVREDDRRMRGVVRIDEPQALALAAQLSGRFVVSRSLARALALYADRRRYFASGRRAEIARYLGEPLVARFALPPDTSHDLLLCALYHRTFVTDLADDQPLAPAPLAEAAAVGAPLAQAPEIDVGPQTLTDR